VGSIGAGVAKGDGLRSIVNAEFALWIAGMPVGSFLQAGNCAGAAGARVAKGSGLEERIVGAPYVPRMRVEGNGGRGRGQENCLCFVRVRVIWRFSMCVPDVRGVRGDSACRPLRGSCGRVRDANLRRIGSDIPDGEA
jgi:hypothetical protein